MNRRYLTKHHLIFVYLLYLGVYLISNKQFRFQSLSILVCLVLIPVNRILFAIHVELHSYDSNSC